METIIIDDGEIAQARELQEQRIRQALIQAFNEPGSVSDQIEKIAKKIITESSLV